jgi:hypothetical protein
VPSDPPPHLNSHQANLTTEKLQLSECNLNTDGRRSSMRTSQTGVSRAPICGFEGKTAGAHRHRDAASKQGSKGSAKGGMFPCPEFPASRLVRSNNPNQAIKPWRSVSLSSGSSHSERSAHIVQLQSASKIIPLSPDPPGPHNPPVTDHGGRIGA